jgi:WD40 repeat protein
MHAIVRRQAHHLRDREAAGNPGFVLRQLCLQAAELGEALLAADCRTRQLAADDPGPVLQWTTLRASPALILELGRHGGGVAAVAVLPDGRVATGGGGRVLVWDPAEPGAGPVEVGRHGGLVKAVAALQDGRVATSGADDRVRLWDVQSSSPDSLLACSASVLATSLSPSGARLFIGHTQGGISCWEVRAPSQNTPGARQRAG